MKSWVRLGGLVYWVHESGDIEKRRGNGFLKPFPDKDGYLKIVICSGGKSYNYFLHRVVYEAFNGPIGNGMTIDHVDNNILNNHKDNLQQLSVKDNSVKGNAKHWIFISPDGQKVEVYNLKSFCQEHKLNPSHMAYVHREKPHYHQHKGWRKYHE